MVKLFIFFTESEGLASKEVIVIVCSTIGGIILIVFVAIIIIRYKKYNTIRIKVKPTDKTDGVEDRPTNANGSTFANPSYEEAAAEKSH